MIPRMTTPSAVSAVTRSSTPSTVIVRGILDLEVPPQEHLGVGVEPGPLLVGEIEMRELGIGGDLLDGPGEVEEPVLDRPIGRRPPHQVLEGEVHEGALARGRRRGLGQSIDVGEAERERAARERAHRARRQGSRHRERIRHTATIQPA